MSRVQITVTCGELDIAVELERRITYGDEAGEARQLLAECVRRIEQALGNPAPREPSPEPSLEPPSDGQK